MLQPILAHHTERTVENATQRIDRQSNSKVVATVVGVSVEPGSIVGISITTYGMGKRFSRLMYRVVIEVI